MPYASATELSMAAGGAERFRDLTDWDGDGVADESVVAEALARADGLIDSYLRLRYATPIAGASDTLKRLSADEAVYWLRKSRGMVSDQDAEQHKERLTLLSQMREGKLRPDEPLPTKSTAVRGAWVNSASDVSRDGTKGMW